MLRAFVNQDRLRNAVVIKAPVGSHEIGKDEQSRELQCFCPSRDSRFTMMQQVLCDIKRMLEFCPNTGLQML